jgi:hypothetical protein
MARAYSLDLRERVVGAVAEGQSCRSVAKTFMVSVASVVKWSQRHRAVGSPAALKMGGHRRARRIGFWRGSPRSRISRCGLCSRSWPNAAWWSAIMRSGIFSSIKA